MKSIRSCCFLLYSILLYFIVVPIKFLSNIKVFELKFVLVCLCISFSPRGLTIPFCSYFVYLSILDRSVVLCVVAN